MRKICTRCILDNTVPEITYDEKGICNYCKINDEIMREYPAGEEGDKLLHEMVLKIKKHGKGKKYDCIIGVSGGTDSTYTLYLMKKMGLRPLAVHFDNGWNSEIAVENIKNATDILDVDLYTLVADWEEFKDMQVAFLKSSTPDAEVPTDYAIISVLLKVASKENINYIIEGQASRAEGTTPLGWTYHDGRYLRSVQKKYGLKKAKSFPVLSLFQLLYFFFVKRVKLTRPLEFMDYSKKMAKEVNTKELGWKDPGGHHHESIFTKFFQSYYLTNKFNIDKRKRECSAKIRSGKMTREDGLQEVSKAYPVEEGIVDYVKSKLGLSDEDFENIMSAPNKSFLDYPTYFPLIQMLRWPIKIACKLHIFPPIFYYKYGVDHSTRIQKYWEEFNKNRK
jgi:N-acetyl sugar amidotransferase